MDFPAYSVPCCDNCMRRENPEKEFSDVTEFLGFMLPSLETDEPTPTNTTTNHSAKATKGTGPRREERRAACRDFLLKWRVDCWLKNHKDEVWGPEVLLSDKVLTKLAATASLQTKEDIRDEVEGWWFWERYAQEVLDGLKVIDARFEAVKATKEADRLEQQRVERERRAAIASTERQRLLEEKERKRVLKEAATQEVKRQKEEVKRQREEVKRQKEEQREETKRQREEAKRQREEEKRQREEAKQQREEAKQQREATKRQRGEKVEAEAGRQHNHECVEHNKKRRRASYTPFAPISSTVVSAAPIQSDPPTRPRPRPTRRAPPVGSNKNLIPVSQPVSPHPVSPSFPPPTGFYSSEMQPQFTPPPYSTTYPSYPTSPGTTDMPYRCERSL